MPLAYDGRAFTALAESVQCCLSMTNMFQRHDHAASDDTAFFATVSDLQPTDEVLNLDDFNMTRGDLYNHLIAIACHADEVELPSREELLELLEPLKASAGRLFGSILDGDGTLDEKLDFISDIFVTDNNERCEMIEEVLHLSATMEYLSLEQWRKVLRDAREKEKYEDMTPQEALTCIYQTSLNSDVTKLMRLVSEREQTRALIREEQARSNRRGRDIAAVALGAGFVLLARRYFKG